MSGLYDPIRYTDLVLIALQRFPARVAFRQDGIDITFAQLSNLLARWISFFQARGLRPGDGVGMLSPNRPEVWLTQTAPLFAGGRFTALHPMGSFEDHLHACNDAEVKFLVVDPVWAERASQLAAACPSVEAVFMLGHSGAGENLNALVEKEPAARLDGGPHGPRDAAWVLYTGGTTGVPKAAVVTESALAQMVLGMITGHDLPEHKRFLASSPITHAAGMYVTPTLLTGGTVVLHGGFDPERWLKTVEQERITLALLVPTMIYSVLDDPHIAKADLSSLQTVMYGASPVSPARLAEGLQRMGPVFCQLYGQTECVGMVTSLWREHHVTTNIKRLSSCGLPVPGVRVAILDDNNQPVADGEPGEICVQGPTVMREYWRQPEQTEAALRGGWLHTGDVAVRDDEGFLYIVDRKKDMIVSGGFNVFPREIEDVLSAHPAVSAVAVIGVPDAKWGEAVKAIVTLRPGSTADAQDLIALVRDKKGPVYAPKTIDFVESIPATGVGKPDKKALRAKYWGDQTRQVN